MSTTHPKALIEELAQELENLSMRHVVAYAVNRVVTYGWKMPPGATGQESDPDTMARAVRASDAFDAMARTALSKSYQAGQLCAQATAVDGMDTKRLDYLSSKARLVKYDSGWKASFDVSVNGLGALAYHTDFRAAIDADIDAQAVPNLLVPANLAAASGAAPESSIYVWPVPDKCDRIKWRGAYHHLPVQPSVPPATPAHREDAVVDCFAAAMKAKLATARAKGRSGWDDPAQCTQDQLTRALREHVHKGDPVDVANFAMFLHQRGESTKLMPQPLPPDLKAAIDAAPEGATVIEHNGHPVFLNRGNEDLRALADALAKIHDLCAEVVSIKYLEGEIVLRIPNNGEVPQWLDVGAVVDLLYHPAEVA